MGRLPNSLVPGSLLILFSLSLQVIYELGYGGILYTLLVFVTENARFKYRPLAIGFTKVPYIATTFAGPRAAEAFYTLGQTKWAFGSFLIILPSIAGPVFCILLKNQSKAITASPPIETKGQGTKRDIFSTLFYYLRDFDGRYR